MRQPDIVSRLQRKRSAIFFCSFPRSYLDILILVHKTYTHIAQAGSTVRQRIALLQHLAKALSAIK